MRENIWGRKVCRVTLTGSTHNGELSCRRINTVFQLGRMHLSLDCFLSPNQYMPTSACLTRSQVNSLTRDCFVHLLGLHHKTEASRFGIIMSSSSRSR